jgi:two-component system phosphate regulon sensor histidine kinase PhoR
LDKHRQKLLLVVSGTVVFVLFALTVAAGFRRTQIWEVLLLCLAAGLAGVAFVLSLHRLSPLSLDLWEGKNQVKEVGQEVYQLARNLQQNVDRLLEERDRSELLRQTLVELSAAEDPRQELDRILHRAMRAVGARWGSILLIDEKGQLGEAFLTRSVESDQARLRTAKVLEKGFAGWVARNRRGSVIYDTLKDPRWLTFHEDEEKARSAVAVPFLPRERVLGVMVLSDPEPYRFDDADLTLLSQLGQQAAICLENAELYIAASSERRKLAAILAGTMDGVVAVDGKGEVILLNPAAEQALGVQAKEVVGQPVDKAIPHPELVSLFERALKGTEAVVGELVTEDGRVRNATISPIAEVGWVAILHDVTYLKELDRVKSEFVATVSHDLRSPLTRLRGFADLIAEDPSLKPQQQEAVRRIQATVAEMTQLVNDLLELGEIEAGIGMEMSPCHLEEVVLEVVDSFLLQAQQAGLTLRTEIEGALGTIRGNAARLRQVVANLLDNAIKYTPAGGSVTVRLSRKGREIVLSVADTGIGIAAQDQEQLFQKFYRIKSPQTAGVPGTGLGLAIARSIIEQHGGRIWVRSAPGQGSTFAFALPSVGELGAPAEGMSSS